MFLAILAIKTKNIIILYIQHLDQSLKNIDLETILYKELKQQNLLTFSHYSIKSLYLTTLAMFKKIASLLGQKHKNVLIFVRRGRQETPISCKVGDNLMDVTNSTVNADANIYGLCDKQLACTTCRVDIQSRFQKLPLPSQEQLDVLLTTKNYNENTSRMACQISITQQLQSMVVRVDASQLIRK